MIEVSIVSYFSNLMLPFLNIIQPFKSTVH